MHHFPASFLLLTMASCRACGEPSSPLTAIPGGSYGHETMELSLASHGDRLVAAYASLYGKDAHECACLLDLRRQGPGSWVADYAGEQVELTRGDDSLQIGPVGGEPIDLACCGQAWSGDTAPLSSHRPMSTCRTVSEAAEVFLPVPYVEEPTASDRTTRRGDVFEGTRLFRAFDVWVLGHIPGPGGLVGLVRIEELDCGS